MVSKPPYDTGNDATTAGHASASPMYGGVTFASTTVTNAASVASFWGSSVKTTMAPVTLALSDSAHTIIGRIMVDFAYLEWLVAEVTYVLLRVNPKFGRIALGTPEIGARMDRLVEIARLTGFEHPSLRLDALSNELTDLGGIRNDLAHGIWLQPKNDPAIYLRKIRGNLKKSVKRRHFPESERMTNNKLQMISNRITVAHLKFNEILQCARLVFPA